MSMNSTRRRFMATAVAGIGLVARGRASAPEAQRPTTSTESTDARLVEESSSLRADCGGTSMATVAAAGAHVQAGEVAPRPAGFAPIIEERSR
jgi:hypothetical protein